LPFFRRRGTLAIRSHLFDGEVGPRHTHRGLSRCGCRYGPATSSRLAGCEGASRGKKNSGAGGKCNVVVLKKALGGARLRRARRGVEARSKGRRGALEEALKGASRGARRGVEGRLAFAPRTKINDPSTDVGGGEHAQLGKATARHRSRRPALGETGLSHRPNVPAGARPPSTGAGFKSRFLERSLPLASARGTFPTRHSRNRSSRKKRDQSLAKGAGFACRFTG
jgi:hypothetical protein